MFTVFMILIGLAASIVGIGLYMWLGLLGSAVVAIIGGLIYWKVDKTIAVVLWLSLFAHVFLMFQGP